MTLAEYAVEAAKTNLYPQDRMVECLQLEFLSEIGEVAGKAKKAIRDGHEVDREGMLYEIGDCCWSLVQLDPWIKEGITQQYAKGKVLSTLGIVYALYAAIDPDSEDLDELFSRRWGAVADLSATYGSTLEEVCAMNIEKLRSRAERGKISGEGDHR